MFTLHYTTNVYSAFNTRQLLVITMFNHSLGHFVLLYKPGQHYPFVEMLGPGKNTKHKVLNPILGPNRYTKLGLPTHKQTFRTLPGHPGG